MPFEIPTISDEELEGLQPLSYKERQREGPPNAIEDDFGNKIDPNRVMDGPGFSITAGEYYSMDATQRRALKNQGLEDLAGSVELVPPGLDLLPGARDAMRRSGAKLPTLRPLAQFFNATSSEGFTEGLVTGPINAVSKLGNALGDVILRQPVDVSDAWVITDEQAARINPGRYSINKNDVFEQDTAADVAGRPLGRIVGAEVLGTVTGAGIARRLSQIPAIARAGNALLQTRRARELAFLYRRSPDAARNFNLLRGTGEALGSTTTAALYMDPLVEGNTLNALDDVVIDPSNRGGVPFVRAVRDDETGIRLPGRIDAENQNYLDALRDQVLVDGLLAPLSVAVGIGSIKPLRNALVGTEVPRALNDLAEAELAPYAPSTQPLLAPAAAVDVVPDGSRILPQPRYTDDPSTWPTNGDQSWRLRQTVPEDSAIGRAQSSNLQVQQVEAQRARLEEMGLEARTFDGQYELTFPSNVSPEVAQQIRALQRQRYELIRANSGVDVSPEVVKQSDQIEAQIQALQSGGGQEMIPGLEIPVREQGQYGDVPDPRPELSTYLAELDELSDQQLRDMLPKVSRDERLAQRQQQLNATQQQVADLEQQLIEIQSRMALPEGSKKRLTATGAKRLTNKIQKQLDAARVEMQRLEVDPAAPVLVGDQLAMELTTPPTMRQLDALAEEAAPNTFDQIDQLVADGKAALVDMEFDEQLGVYRPVGAEVQQGYSSVAEYKSDLMGWPRELLRRMNAPNASGDGGAIAAILKARTGRRVWSAKKEDIVDAMVEFAQRQGKFAPRLEQLDLELQQTLNLNADPEFPGGRGLTGEAREDLKRQILQAAIDNGEVQPDATPIPTAIPQADYNQGELIDSLLADETGQLAMAFADDAVPIYDIPTPKSAELKIEEIRNRYDWAVMDNQARQAANASYLKEKGWDTLTWEEKKRQGLLGTQFSMPGDENAITYTGVLKPEEPGYNKFADLSDQVPTTEAPKEKVVRWSLFGNLKEEAAKRRDQLRATRKPKRTAVTAENRAAARNQRQLDATEKDLQARLDQLKKQAEEATCNG